MTDKKPVYHPRSITSKEEEEEREEAAVASTVSSTTSNDAQQNTGNFYGTDEDYRRKLLAALSSAKPLASTPHPYYVIWRPPALAELFVKTMAMSSDLVLMMGVVSKKPILFLPWMVIYGGEVAASWALGLAFLLLPGMFRTAALVCLVRSFALTYCWVCLVRRHLKEVSEMINRPRLQTILSIMTAHPFSPRPEVELSSRPPPPTFD